MAWYSNSYYGNSYSDCSESDEDDDSMEEGSEADSGSGSENNGKGEESESDLEDDPSCIRARIFAALSAIHNRDTPAGKPPEFAYTHTYGPDEAVPNPGLHVTGVGPIGMPLSPRDKKDIIASPHCKASPFGDGEKTRVDARVRKTVQIDNAHFATKNPVFITWLDRQVATAASEMGIVGAITVQPYKLLIYEEGSFFKAHKDSEKAPGMIGTFVFCLPSKHLGGAVHLSHGDKSKTFDSASGSDYGYSIAGWYADVTHEVSKVTSGCRVAITFNMIIEQSTTFSMLASERDKFMSFDSLIQEWDTSLSESSQKQPTEDDDDTPRKMVYVMSHKYSEASIKSGITALKGPDRTLCEFLLAESKGRSPSYKVYIANLTKYIMGDYDEGSGHARSHQDGGNPKRIKTVEEHKEGVKCIVEAKTGKSIGDGKLIVIDLSERCQHLYPLKPNRWEESGFTGNEGATAEHWYHTSVLIIVPKSLQTEFEELASRPSTTDALQALLWHKLFGFWMHGNHQSREALLNTCLKAVEYCAWDKPKRSWYPGTDPSSKKLPVKGAHSTYLAECAVHLGNIQILEKMFESAKDKSRLFRQLAFPTMAQAIRKFGFVRARNTFLNFKLVLQPETEHTYYDFPSSSMDNNVSEVADFVLKFLTLLKSTEKDIDVFRCCSSNIPKNNGKVKALSPAELPRVQEWLVGSILDYLKTLNTSIQVNSEWTKSTGVKLTNAMKALGGVESFDREVLSSWAENTICLPAIVGAVSASQDESEKYYHSLSRGLDVTTANPTTFASLLVPLRSLSAADRRGYSYNGHAAADVEDLIDPDDLVFVLTVLELFDDNLRQDRIYDILSSLVETCSFKSCFDLRSSTKYTSPVDRTLAGFFLPFVKSGVARLRGSAKFSALCGKILVRYVSSFVGSDVPPLLDPTLVPVKFKMCSDTCGDCRELDAFLDDDREAMAEFRYHQKRRHHMESRLKASLNKGQKPPWTVETFKDRSPHGLIVTKINGMALKRRAAWDERCRLARAEIAGLTNTGSLNSLLGEAEYRALVNTIGSLDLVKPTSIKDSSQKKASQAASKKRKIEKST